MEDSDVIAAFSALGQLKRLEAFRLLLNREPQGLHAGDLAKIMDAPFNTMSAHLAILSRAGLVTASKSGRFITYRADTARLVDIMGHLFKDCCAGQPELCVALFEQLQQVVAKQKKRC